MTFAVKRAACAVGLTIVAIACGSTPTTPGGGGGTTITVSSVSPGSLSTTGGAAVTITGTGFATDATVTLDGTAVTGVTATPTSITFTAPTHASGAGTFTVTSGGKSATGAVTFVAPSGTNLPPVISNVRTIGSRNNQPSLFVDLNEEVQLIATVSNVETNTTLTYVWAVGAGTVSGTGPSVLWKLPALLTTTPAPVSATLTVTETFPENGVQHRNVATASVLADAHDSQTEVFDKGFKFLDRFSQSDYTAAQVLADFDPSCPGYADEFQDTVDNRTNYLQLPGYSVTRVPPVTFNFGGRCTYSAYGDNRAANGDACSALDARWLVRFKIDVYEDGVYIGPAGSTADTAGRDWVTAVLRNGQWKLCDSQFSASRPTVVTFPSGLTKTVDSLPGFGSRRRPIKRDPIIK